MIELDKYKQRFAERLKKLRETKKLSVAELSRQINIAETPIMLWEKKKYWIKNDELIILTKFFNVTSDYLIGLED